jgi:hypothetical protein
MARLKSPKRLPSSPDVESEASREYKIYPGGLTVKQFFVDGQWKPVKTPRDLEEYNRQFNLPGRDKRADLWHFTSEAAIRRNRKRIKKNVRRREATAQKTIDRTTAAKKKQSASVRKPIPKLATGGVVDGASYSRGTGAQVRGRIFRGVF